MAKHFFRSAVLEPNPAEVETGTVRLSFASELPVLRTDKRGKYWEVLSHSPGDANLGLLNRNGMVLQDHDEKLEIGDVVKDSAKVDADRKTRANIKLFDGIWLNRAKTEPTNIPISVGYTRLSELRQEPADAEGIITRVWSWRPYEISLLTCAPADDTVGINRSMVKRQCVDCSGNGRCACRDADDSKADKDCEYCGGNGKCSDCGGSGYFESARAKQIDSPTISDVERLLTNLNAEDKKRMKILLDAKSTEGGGISVTEAEAKLTEQRAASEKAERNRANEISLAADEFIKSHGKKNEGKASDEIRKFANDAILKGDTFKDFTVRCLTYVSNAAPEQVRARDFVPAEDMAQFSLVRAIQSAFKNRLKGGEGRPDEKSVEGQICKAYEEKCRQADGGMGYEPAGFVIPPDAQFGTIGMSRKEMLSVFRAAQNRFGRDMQANVFGAGGAVVPTYWLLPVIDLLRNKMALSRVGIRTMGGLTGNVIIPRLEAPSTAYSVGEIAALAASQQTLGQVAMTPHRVGVTENYSKQLVFQSSPDIEALIRDDIFKVLALKWDALGLFGQGAASEPLGILNTPGIGVVTFGATPTYIKMVLFETLIRNQNVQGILSYISTSATKGSLKTVAEALTGATTIGGSMNAIWKGIGGDGGQDGMVNGYQAVDTQQMPNNQVLCGMFDDFIHGMFGGFDVVTDIYTKAANAEVVLTMNTWGDFAARHPQAFCASSDSGNQ